MTSVRYALVQQTVPIIESVVSQHSEEVAFLWLLRNVAVAAPHYSLKYLAELDDRVEAHIDGLRVAGPESWPFCAAGLERQCKGRVRSCNLTRMSQAGSRAIPLRFEMAGGFYHVTARGDRREPIYRGDADRTDWLNL